MTLYLIRHAQCAPKRSLPFSDWPLSPVGARQAEELAGLLDPVEIANVFSSPFVRTLETARPFAQKRGLAIRVVDDLRERLLTHEPGLPSEELWRRSWEDFAFCLPGCETSLAAQARICRAIRDIAQTAEGASAIFTHGNVIPLFLNALTKTIGRAEAEALRNPDVLRIGWSHGAFTWDRAFRLAGLERIATDHRQTPKEQETLPPERVSGMTTLHPVGIRPFRGPDLGSVRKLIHETMDRCYAAVYPPRAVRFFKEFHSEERIVARHQQGEVLVVEQDGNLVATGAIVGSEILGVFVHPEFQRRGHGAALMRELENRARARGCTELELSVSLPSRRFYEGLGYQILEECSTDVGEGEHLDFWKARKPLKDEAARDALNT